MGGFFSLNHALLFVTGSVTRWSVVMMYMYAVLRNVPGRVRLELARLCVSLLCSWSVEALPFVLAVCARRLGMCKE